MSTASLVAEGRWAHMQGLRIIVDFASGSNLYPDLHLCNNSAREFNASIARMEAVLLKMAAPVTRFNSDGIVSLVGGPSTEDAQE
eukprot:m.1072412 g.1072412  ORF g.1072412 m.1072412 type:complete len:85 (+) comp24231_c0_seq113:4124-4378(+)